MPIRLPIPAGPKITIRFVLHEGWAADAIAISEGTFMPFAPGHAEGITPEGTHIGQFGEAHVNAVKAGMQELPEGYDTGQIRTLPNGRPCDLWVDLACTQAQADAFYSYMRASLGEPYDWRAILGFAIPFHAHELNHAICSAKVALGLRKAGIFPWPLPVPAHLINPGRLLLLLSVLTEVPH
jgi:hypothetical protein